MKGSKVVAMKDIDGVLAKNFLQQGSSAQADSFSPRGEATRVKNLDSRFWEQDDVDNVCLTLTCSGKLGPY